MNRLPRLLAALLLLVSASAALAEERILRFHSDVRIQQDSSLEVTETIDVQVENNAINHGIYRDFPTRYPGRNGSQVRVGFEFQGATLDGQPAPAATEAMRNGVRIRIGDAEKYVPVGEHRFVIRYRTTRQIGRFAGYDELYWNATGNGWQFPIDVAEARITLPSAASFGQRAAYTGPQGSTASDAEVVEEQPGSILFRTTRPLGAYEGLTVAAAFPKGVVAEASSSDRRAWWLADYGPPLVAVLGLIGLAAFYFVAWKRAGRNPRPGTVVPIFAPPDEFSPAAMRYVTKMGIDNRAFAAALVDLGVRGHLRIVEEEGGWLARDKRRVERLASDAPLPSPEQAMLERLLAPGESRLMEQKEHAYFGAAKKVLNDSFAKQFEGKLFKRNWGWALAGAALFVAMLWLTAAAIVAATGALETNMVLIAFGAITTTILLLLFLQGVGAVGKCLVLVAAFLSGAVSLAVGMPILGAAVDSGWYLPLIIVAAALPIVISAFFWIAAPTKEGRAVLDRIAGFKQYLSITERERLDRMHPPEQDTPALFERYLPYAVALGVENRWAERFSGVLAAAAAQGQQGANWYSGSSNPWDDPDGFADSIGSSLASTVSSASTAPGSRSGSGGGGSSGGGGGGGGGGGW